MITIYGIKNCDTMKKTFHWLDISHVKYNFHDFKKQGLDEKTLNYWFEKIGWEALLNKRGTTFRKLSDDIKNNINEKTAKNIMLENLSIIKRPVLDVDGQIIVGFDSVEYEKLFK